MHYSDNMRKISLKTLLCAVFCILGVVYLSGCAEPIGLASFAGDPEVAGIVDKGAGTVYVYHDPGSNLTEGNKRITGLESDKYYMIEEWAENVFQNYGFVSPDGTRSENLTDIGWVDGGAITGLTNYHHYRVRAAEPLTEGSISYTSLPLGGSSGTAAIKDGEIRLPAPASASDYNVYMLVPSSPYDAVVGIARSPTPHASPVSPGIIIAYVGNNTEVDYVFFRTAGSSSDFSVLKVLPGSALEPGPDVTVTFNSWNYTAGTNGEVDIITRSSGSTIGNTNMPSPSPQTGYTFLGWYTADGHASGGANASNWGTQFSGTTTVNADMNVYARWLKDGELDDITGVTLNPLGGTSIILSKSVGTPPSVAEGDPLTVAIGDMLVLTVQNAGAFSLIEWKRNGSNVATGNTLTFAPGGGSNAINSNAAGKHVIVVRAVTAGGQYQSSHFYVEVKP